MTAPGLTSVCVTPQDHGAGVERPPVVRVLPPPARLERRNRPLCERAVRVSQARNSRLDAAHHPITGLPIRPTGREWPIAAEGRPYFDVELAHWTVGQLEAFVGEKDIPAGSLSRFTRKAAAMLTLDAKRYLMWSYDTSYAVTTGLHAILDWRLDVPSPDELAALLGDGGRQAVGGL